MIGPMPHAAHATAASPNQLRVFTQPFRTSR
jgi:hypothetical protein